MNSILMLPPNLKYTYGFNFQEYLNSYNIDGLVATMSLSNYELKQYIIANQYDRALYVLNNIQYKKYCDKELTQHDIENLKKYSDAISLLNANPTLMHEAEKVSHARYSRATKLYKTLELFLTFFPCTFVTLTFNDDTLNSTSLETKRKYVKRYLKSQGLFYVANVDYGSKNGRVHFHAVVTSQSLDLKKWHKYGAIKTKKIIVSTDKNSDASKCVAKINAKRLGKYISKLTNHAIKETATGCRVIYSENIKSLNHKINTLKQLENDKSIALGVDLFGFDLKVYKH